MCSLYLYILLCNRAPWKNSVTEWFTLYEYIWKKKKYSEGHSYIRGISAETCGLDDVFPSDDLGSGPYTRFIIIYMPCIIAAF